MSINKEAMKKSCSILGAHLVMAPWSIVWFYGNLSAYMDSYFMFSCYKCMDGDSQWILALFGAGQVPGVFLVKPFTKIMGLKVFGMVVTVIGNLALLSTAWSCQYSVAGTAALYGILIGTCTGAHMIVALQLVSGCAPERTSFFMATVTSFPAILSVIQNQIITVYVNPENLKADAVVGPRTYFSQPSILHRVPGIIIVLAVMTFGLQLLGYILITDLPKLEGGTPTNTVNGSINSESVDIVSCYETTKPSHSSRVNVSTSDFNHYGSNESNTELNSDTCLQSSNHCSSNGTAEHLNTQAHDGKKDTPTSYTPCETLLTPAFYSLFFFGIVMEYALLLKANFYKQFGQVYIKNDHYLTLVGTLMPIASICSRLLFGYLFDRGLLSIKEGIIISLSLNTFVCALWYLIAQVNALLYLFLMVGLGVAQGAYFIIAPCAIPILFGPEHLSVNYALTNSSVSIASFLTPLIVSPLLHDLGWFWLFTSCSLASLLTLCLVVASNFKT